MVQETFAATLTVEDILSTAVVLRGLRQVAIPGKVFVVHKFWSFPSML
jgi:hypothetical protein